MSSAKAASYSAARIAGRVKTMGRAISKAYGGRRLDVVVTMDRSFVFAADLVRAIDGPVAVHFVREDVRDVETDGQVRREVFFGNRQTTGGGEGPSEFKGRDILLVDAVLDSGVTQEFLLRRIGENKPRSLRLAVLLDKAAKRRVALEPDYFGFQTASNEMWCGYGLAGSNGLGRNGKSLISGERASGGSRRAKKGKR
ncbi:MAG TPA: phosphoribosyltransferase family protein [Candidatus Sulfotelmatobacter sp.]|nr:phosphoribosyltransferase family protein [Candidatus Sulfotelmatobacter sp.]